MSTVFNLTNGGLPRGWTVHNLAWLAEQHRYLGRDPNATDTTAKRLSQRADWHRRWAALLEDILETRRVSHP